MKQSNKKKEEKQKFKGIGFMLFVAVLYLILYFFHSDQIQESVKHFGKNLLMLLPIFLLVILLSAIINYFFPKEKIVKMLQKQSTYKTYIYSLVAGIISHGPIFAWFPLLKELKDKGISKGTLITFIYGRSIKITLLPVMLGFFGKWYVIIFIFYLAIGALVQGFIYDRLEK